MNRKRVISDPVVRFWEKVNKTEGCWLWTASKNAGGYGQFWGFEGRFLAHRYSWLLHFGDIPPDLCVLHRCDVRVCVRSDHLFLGTAADNVADMISKNRHVTPLGETHGRAVLTELRVAEIRALYGTGLYSQKYLGVKFGVSAVQICRIVNNKRWEKNG